MSLPATAVLSSLLALTSHVISPAVVSIPDINWSEPALVWISINMPTGSGKSSLYKYLYNLTCEVRRRCAGTDKPTWLVGDATFDKMGELMSYNNGCLFGLYDELSTFLTQLNLYRGKGLTFSHELALFLQLYNGSSWSRQTGVYAVVYYNHCIPQVIRYILVLSFSISDVLLSLTHMNNDIIIESTNQERKKVGM